MGNPTNRPRDFYDTISDDRIREIAKKRGIPKYKTDLFVGTALREYMRAVDYDQERAEEPPDDRVRVRVDRDDGTTDTYLVRRDSSVTQPAKDAT